MTSRAKGLFWGLFGAYCARKNTYILLLMNSEIQADVCAPRVKSGNLIPFLMDKVSLEWEGD